VGDAPGLYPRRDRAGAPRRTRRLDVAVAEAVNRPPTLTDLARPAGRLGELPGRVRGLLTLLRWGCLVAPVVLVALFGLASWQRMIAAAEVEATRKAQLVREYAQRTVEAQDILIAAADRARSEIGAGPEGALRMHRFLVALNAQFESDQGIVLVAPDGRALLSSDEHPPRARLGLRDYLLRAQSGGLFVDQVRLDETGPEALIIARRAAGAAEPGPVWVSAVLVETLAEFLSGIAGGGGDAASLIRADGRILVRNAPMSAPIVLPPDAPAMRAIAGGGVAPYRAVAVADGVSRLYVTRQVGSLPLYANYGVSLEALRAAWLRQVALVGALVGAVGLIGFGVVVSAGRALASEAGRAALDFDRKLLHEAQKTAAARETMLRELSHRMKNNLQMVQSLIRLQKTREAGPDLDEISARVAAIAGIHDLLYRSGDAFEVDLAALLRTVAANAALVPPERGIEVACDLEPVQADASVATPLALCAVELITNAVKHAFGPQGGTIRVELLRDGARGRLTVADDGRGLPEQPQRHSGRRVVDALVAQLQGTLTVEPGPGTRVRIDFPLAPGAPADA
jgi:two-component sensor histidine kinase